MFAPFGTRGLRKYPVGCAHDSPSARGCQRPADRAAAPTQLSASPPQPRLLFDSSRRARLHSKHTTIISRGAQGRVAARSVMNSFNGLLHNLWFQIGSLIFLATAHGYIAACLAV